MLIKDVREIEKTSYKVRGGYYTNKKNKKMEQKGIKIGIIGCGYWGPNLIRNFNNLDDSQLAYVCDIDKEKLKKIKSAFFDTKITTNYLEVLEDESVDAIVIATPVFKHYQLAKDALLHNKHVLIEKPMTSTSEQAKEIIQIAKEKNKILMIDHTFEYSEAINKIKEIINSGELGEIYYLRAEWLNLGLLQPDVNVIWDLAPHILSVINYIINLKPLRLNAKAEGYIRKEIPEIAQIQIKYDRGVSAYLSFGWLEPKKTRTITIVGNKKLLVYDLTNNEEPIKIYDKNVEMIQNENVRQSKVNYKYGDTYSPSIKNIEPLNTMCKHFLNSIRYDKKPRSDGESGLKIIEILESIDKSVKENGKEIILEDSSNNFNLDKSSEELE